MPTDHHHPDAAAAAAGKGAHHHHGGGKVHKLLKSAFKRGGDHHHPGSGGGGGDQEGDLLSRSASGSSSTSAASSSRAASSSSGRRGGGGRRGDDTCSSVDGESGELDGSKNAKVLAALRDAKISYAYESFPWEKKMKELLPVPAASCFLSMLLLPKSADGSHTRYKSLEDTLARADAWLVSSQAAGVPVAFMNVQTEALLTKISGEMALSTVNMGSLSDLANMANASLYGFEDYHGVDIGVVRAVRLWYTPVAGEAALEIKLLPGDTRLGFAISRTEEGFIYVSSVAEESTPGVASTRSGLLELHRAARRASRLLVVSRVGGEKVLPWMVSTAGDVKCFDTVSLSQKLSLHRHALRPITLHFLMWDTALAIKDVVAKPPLPPPPTMLMLPSPPSPPPSDAEGDAPPPSGDGDEAPGSGAKGGKDSSFRFQNIDLLPDSWL
ncbi:uncharacterized protein [Oryza sativa Japonica Group]|uniref:Os09g0281800 protein n=3 Tax=Oryza TaxID=4527 RepID=Q6ENK6_ORYSJ|nr:uncharacterized protein LOC4346615 [Oryza sativa Japonica Group]KAB8109934.1 hypothetical protein EE612_046559 [Oryza sativa]KAF2915449.1 hypothetical protein DAI22_09g034600 [Oryza sativa Japonica Group]BAD29647.1 unknown protein [Oryza sativa Japonica Group]BAF24684.1 Os09g0281800 [Oryza sativa Japonica Group]BAG97183.1 unnamed protein product [Oryza sativa Japonica Group]|eukprot:NP_001062770.1 Os09g0281800 [Oryza sativa Japonica Group]